MKLDKIAFATLIGYCANRGMNVDSADVRVLDNIIDIDVTPVEVPGKVSSDTLNELMRAIHNGEKIAAIKAYRTMTGFGLKEAKDAIERDWKNIQTKDDYVRKMNDKINSQMRGDYHPNPYILRQFNSVQLNVIREFINSF